MEDNTIKDNQLYSPAWASAGGTTAKDARLNGNNAWCISERIVPGSAYFDSNIYLQIDLLKPHKISSILLQGVKSGPYSYGQKIRLLFKTSSAERFKQYITKNGAKVNNFCERLRKKGSSCYKCF